MLFVLAAVLLSPAACVPKAHKNYYYPPERVTRHEPPSGHDGFDDGTFKIQFLIMGANPDEFFITANVSNVSDQDAAFDPGQVELKVVETNTTYFHITKDKSAVTLSGAWADEAVFMPTTLRPGQTITGVFYFPVGGRKASANAIEVYYGGKTLRFPPEEPDAGG
jgi:hypothetical protein